MATLCGWLLPAVRGAGVVWAATLGGLGSALANVPPNTPTVTEPSPDGRIVSAEDVHMETGGFSDPDVGDTHVCSDWEIWTLVGGAAAGALSERVWFASCTTGVERLHVHLGDGAFGGSYAGRMALLPSVNYRLRVRHKDSSPDVVTQWSAYAERNFTTAAASVVSPMTLDDISLSPIPTLLDTTGSPVELPAGTTPATLRIEGPTPAPAGSLILEFGGQAAAGNKLTDSATIGAHQPVRIRATAGTLSYAQAATNIVFTDSAGTTRTIYVPGFNLSPGASQVWWVASNGATYSGTPGQTAPDFTTLVRGSPVPWTVRKPGFVVETFATGFQLPVNIAFIPSPGPAADAPLFYVSELYGAIKLVRRNAGVSTYVSGLLNFNPTGAFPGSGEQGVAGLCVDPVSGDLFASMLYDGAPPNGPHYPKVVRFHSNDGGVTAATQTIILNMTGEPQGQSHQVSNLSIGPDGKLYVHVGDGFDSTTAQNNSSFRGKILRLNLDGTAPSDNPFYSVVDGITATDYIYASGVRNPFGGGWRTTDGAHYIVENGPSVDRITKLVRGRNYLWDGSDASMANFALHNWSPAVGPVNIAFVTSGVFGGSGFPATLYGRGFITESGPTWASGPQTNGKRITEVFIDAAGVSATPPIPLVEYNGSGKASCSAIAAGPDGLYFADLYKDNGYLSPIDSGANVLRIRYTGEAAFIATPDSTLGPPPLEVSFTDTSTIAGASAWAWDFGDGTTSTLQNPVHTYTTAGCFTVRLTVTGAAGPVVTQRPNAVRVAQPRPIAFIVGSTTLSAGDAAVADYLRSLCYEVVVFDDETNRRPASSQLAVDYGLVVVSSSIASANVGGEFRTANVPLIFWENALLTTAREALAAAGQTVATQTGVTITNSTHPVTRGLSNGVTVMFTSNQTLSLASGTVAAGTLSPNATVLATRSIASNPPAALMVAESGAALLSGYIAPARRVFAFFDDTSFAAANTAGRTVLGNSVCWTMGLGPTITTQPGNTTRPAGSVATLSVVSAGHPGRTHQWRKAGVALTDGPRISGATGTTLTISNLEAGDAGNYDVVVSTATCGSVTSNAAALTVGPPCVADFNNSGDVSVQDIFDFLSAYFSGAPSADINGVGGVTVQDVFDFLAIYFTGCP